MSRLKTNSVMFVSMVCFAMFGQESGIMQIVRTNDQVGFLLEEPNSNNGFFSDAFILDFKAEGKKPSKPTVESVRYTNYKFDGDTFEVSYIDSKSQTKNEIYDLKRKNIRLKHETGRLYLRDALSQKKQNLSSKRKQISEMIGRVTPMGRNCSCSHLGSSCQISCPSGTSAVCLCDDSGSACFCESKKKPIKPSDPPEKIPTEESSVLTNDPIRIAIAPTLVHSSVNFKVINGGNTTYYIEFFDLHGRSAVNKQVLPEKLDLLNQRKGMYFYTITGDDGYVQKGKIMKI